MKSMGGGCYESAVLIAFRKGYDTVEIARLFGMTEA